MFSRTWFLELFWNNLGSLKQELTIVFFGVIYRRARFIHTIFGHHFRDYDNAISFTKWTLKATEKWNPGKARNASKTFSWFSLFKRLPWCPGLPEYIQTHDKLKGKKTLVTSLSYWEYFLSIGLFLSSASPPNSAILTTRKQYPYLYSGLSVSWQSACVACVAFPSCKLYWS